MGGSTWVAGHANPDLGVVLVSIAPGENQSMEMERQIPHELAHVLLYRLTGPAYANLPNWLTEGIASQVEGYPNADYTQVLTASAQTKPCCHHRPVRAVSSRRLRSHPGLCRIRFLRQLRSIKPMGPRICTRLFKRIPMGCLAIKGCPGARTAAIATRPAMAAGRPGREGFRIGIPEPASVSDFPGVDDGHPGLAVGAEPEKEG